MSKTVKNVPVLKILIPLYAGIAILFIILIRRGNMQLLEPAGYIADMQSRILWGAIIFACIVASIILSAFYIVIFRYRESRHARYEPDWVAGKVLQLFGWGIPFVVIVGVSTMIWVTAHQVDPYQPISSTVAPVSVQVVALRWKWLFIYPDQKVATVNKLVIPANTPIALQLTADAPMNSFWVPRLSGQVYAMTGMVTQLHLEADHPGTYNGSPAEISGDGFAGMTFTVEALSQSDYSRWLTTAQKATQSLDLTSYTQLAQPSSYNQPATYRLTYDNLFDVIVMQFMEPGLDPTTLSVRGASL